MKGNTKPAWKTNRKVQNNYDNNSEKEEKKKKIEAPDDDDEGANTKKASFAKSKAKLQRKVKKI